uniref:Neural cell adhesion molecule L1.1-like n=1 Tax=Echeneis naucrates TaxID=173247 RepID=A0A665VLJ3_ECHNA
MGYRGLSSPASPPLVLLFLLPLSSPPFAQGAIHIPKDLSQPPVLTDMPTSYTAFSREDIYLPCAASGNPTPTFRWVKDGEAFGSERPGTGTLRAEDDEPLEVYDGNFRCYASNMLGTAMTKTVRVIVERESRTQRHKVCTDAYEGESIILACSPPESSTPPNIHWMDRKMVHITRSDRVMVGLDGKLYFANLLKNDSRDDYICNAQYSAARTILPVAAVRLTVKPSNDVVHKKPHLLHPPGSHSSVKALRGHSLTLECIPKGLPTPRVEWKKKDGRLEETNGVVENHGRWLSFSSISQSDDGEYECRASNGAGFVLHSFTVTVEAAPFWVKEPQNLLYAPGENVRLDCQAEGIPTPRLTWSINGRELSGDGGGGDSRRSVFGGVLILRDVEFADTAVYQCEATNIHGSALINTYLYVIELPPQILSSDGVVYRVTEGGDVRLHCETFGSPRPHITWNGEDMVSLLSDPRVSLLTNGTIELSYVSHEDSGTYTCSVKNTNISISAHVEVFSESSSHPLTFDLKGCCHSKHKSEVWSNLTSPPLRLWICSVGPSARPDPPKDLTLSDIADHSLTLSWIPGNSHNLPIRGQQHAEEEKWQWVEWKKVPADFNHLQLTLHPYCTYRFRVIAVNDAGRSNPSSPSDIHRTPPAVPDRNPTGVHSDSTDPKLLVITWKEMPKYMHNGEDFQYKVFWREAGGTGAHWNEGYVKSPPFVVNSTGPYTPFEIKVQAVNSIGSGPPPEAEIGHSGEDSTSREIHVRWLGPDGIRGRRSLGKLHHEEEREGRARERDKHSRVVVVHGKKTYGEVKDLKLFSSYGLTVSAFNSKGDGPQSLPHHFNTPEGVPGPPASLSFESPTERSLILHWTPPLESNGILLGYMVQYQQGGAQNHQVHFHIMKHSDTSIIEHKNEISNLCCLCVCRSVFAAAGYDWETSEMVNSTQGFYTLSGLQPGTEYQLKIMHGNNTQWDHRVSTLGPVPTEMRGGFATQGWLIGLISAIVLLVLILLILCLIKRSRGGKYAVKDKEDKEVDSEARPMKDETFGEYSDGDEKRSDSQPSLCGESKLGSDDSLAEYGDSVDIQFNEDGSFIGQYSGRGPVPHGNESSGPASPVNAIPPPPIAPSMSSILNRPS